MPSRHENGGLGLNNKIMRVKKKDRVIAALNEQLMNEPENPKVIEWLYSNFEPVGLGIGNKVVCTECGREFNAEKPKQEGEIVCPHCGKTLTITRTRKGRKRYVKNGFFMVSHIYKGYQVFRLYWVEKFAYFTGNEWITRHHVDDCAHKWIAEDGTVTWFQRYTVTFPNTARNPFNSYPQMHIKYFDKSYDYYYSFDVRSLGYVNAKVISITNWLKYRGINRIIRNGRFYNLWFDEVCELVMQEPMVEALIKKKKFGVLESLIAKSFFRRSDNHYADNQASLKIALRHGFFDSEQFKNVSPDLYVVEWADMLDQLRFFHRDTRSPHYICPKNMLEFHKKMTEKMNAKIEDERLKYEAERRRQELERIAKACESYEEKRKKFFGLEFVSGNMKIRVLPNVDEFKKEGNVMHHCVYTNTYYDTINKPNCLILSARIGKDWNNPKKWAETIEVNLENYTIVQSRGVCNSQSVYHKKVLSLMEKNMNKIKKCNEVKAEAV